MEIDVKSLFPDAARFDGKVEIVAMQIGGQVKRTCGDDAAALARHVAFERRMAESDLFRGVARKTGTPEATLRGEYEVIEADASDDLADATLVLLSLRKRAA